MSTIEHMLGEECAQQAAIGVGGQEIDPAKPMQVQADVYRVTPRSKVVLGTLPDKGKPVLQCGIIR